VRPLTTDDADTAEPGSCQIESWIAHSDDERAIVLSPACGIAPGVELGADFARPHTLDALRTQIGLAVKWAPEAWRVQTPAGTLNLGLKVGVALQQPSGQGWHVEDYAVLALATLAPGEDWTLHGNLGLAREPDGGVTTPVLNLALAWTPHEQLLLFGESRLNSRHAAFGGTVNAIGARWWLLKDRVGLDLTTSREMGASQGKVWTLGFGWYGLNF
jgi:hypothetical protein